MSITMPMSRFVFYVAMPVLIACAPYQAMMVDDHGELYMCLTDRTLPFIARHQINRCVLKMTQQGYKLQGEIKQ